MHQIAIEAVRSTASSVANSAVVREVAKETGKAAAQAAGALLATVAIYGTAFGGIYAVAKIKEWNKARAATPAAAAPNTTETAGAPPAFTDEDAKQLKELAAKAAAWASCDETAAQAAIDASDALNPAPLKSAA